MTADRTLVLLRHAKSAWPSGVADHERPLAARGRRDAPVAGDWLRGADRVPDRVVCSTALRARETWQLVQPRLGSEPPASFEHRLYEASVPGLMDVIRQAPPAGRTLLIIGHNPGIQALAVSLAGTTGDTGGNASASGTAGTAGRMRAAFPTAAIAVLDVNGPWERLRPGRAHLITFVTPRQLRAEGC